MKKKRTFGYSIDHVLGPVSGVGEITWDSEPDYDEWGPDTYWNCADWMVWHKKLAKKFGKEKANDIWLQKWGEQGYWDYARNACAYNNEFVKYFLSQGIDLRTLFSAIFDNVSQILVNTSEAAAETSESVGTLAKNLKWLLPVAGGLAVLGITYVAVNKVEQITEKL